MPTAFSSHVIGLDFGTTNTVVDVSHPGTEPRLVEFAGPISTTDVFRSALCFWEDDTAWSGVAVEAGPWAIAEYLAYPAGCRFIQSFKRSSQRMLSKLREAGTNNERRRAWPCW